MKTINTVLPIYDSLSKQCFVRGRHGGETSPVPVLCPNFRLPSFQWKDEGDMCTSVTKIELMNGTGLYDIKADITSYFSLPAMIPIEHISAGDWFAYNGDNLLSILPFGVFFLRITMDNSWGSCVYYSDWFAVTCIYPTIFPSIGNGTYSTFTPSSVPDGIITSAIQVAASASYALSSGGNYNVFPIKKRESIRVIIDITINSGEAPSIALWNATPGYITNQVQLTNGHNDITLTATKTSNFARFKIYNTIQTNFATTCIMVMREYSENYITINFHNDCDLGDILYHSGFDQTIWLKTEPMEAIFPLVEEGVKNGQGMFVRSFAQQVKKYIIRTNKLPDFLIEALHRLRLHNNIELIDLVGNVNDVYNLEVEHEWIGEDKYYGKAELTFDYNESITTAGCCNNFT